MGLQFSANCKGEAGRLFLFLSSKPLSYAANMYTVPWCSRTGRGRRTWACMCIGTAACLPACLGGWLGWSVLKRTDKVSRRLRILSTFIFHSPTPLPANVVAWLPFFRSHSRCLDGSDTSPPSRAGLCRSTRSVRASRVRFERL